MIHRHVYVGKTGGTPILGRFRHSHEDQPPGHVHVNKDLETINLEILRKHVTWLEDEQWARMYSGQA